MVKWIQKIEIDKEETDGTGDGEGYMYSGI